MFKMVYLMPFMFLLGCSSQSPSQVTLLNDQTGIIGGSEAIAGDEVTLSTAALVTVEDGKVHTTCTGTLIAKDLILTAAHCVTYPRQIYVWFGASLPKAEDLPNLISVSGKSIHPEFKYVQKGSFITGYYTTAVNDMALLRLESEAPEGTVTRPILDETSTIYGGDRLLLAGYGIVEDDYMFGRQTGLNWVYVEVQKVVENMIVTDQTNSEGACAGDSGGPAYILTSKGLTVVGATRGPHAGAKNCSTFGEYTSVEKLKSFILESVSSLGSQSPVFVDR